MTAVPHATEAQWAALNPLLGRGVIVFSRDTGELRVGNGAQRWADLAPIGAGGGGSGLVPRDTVSVSTGSLSAGSGADVSVVTAPSSLVLRVQSEVGVRVRGYSSSADRASDVSRAVGSRPTPGGGLLFEVVKVADCYLSRPAVCYAEDTADTLWLRVDRLSGAGPATVSVTFIPLEG